MVIFIKLGFRNLFRNRRRSLLTASAIGIAVAALIITDGFMEGMIQNMVNTATSGLLGQGQIQHESYIKNPEPENLLKDYRTLEAKLDKTSEVKAWSPRAYSLGMIASPRNSRNVNFIGLDTQREATTTKIMNYLESGEFLPQENSVVIGTRLKEKLGVEIGNKVVLTTAEVGTGELRQDIFRVSGIISFGSKSIDSSMVFIHLAKMQSLLGIKDQYHEIVLNLGSPFAIGDSDALWSNLSFSGNMARPWGKVSPGLRTVIDMSGISIAIIGIIMLILMTLIVFNTLFMAIFERLFEFGVARALGTENRHLVTSMLAESAGLGILAAIFGILIALIAGGLMAKFGIDYGGVEFNDVTFREPIKFIFQVHQWYAYPLATIIFTILMGIYPAVYTTRLNLSHILKKTL